MRNRYGPSSTGVVGVGPEREDSDSLSHLTVRFNRAVRSATIEYDIALACFSIVAGLSSVYLSTLIGGIESLGRPARSGLSAVAFILITSVLAAVAHPIVTWLTRRRRPY